MHNQPTLDGRSCGDCTVCCEGYLNVTELNIGYIDFKRIPCNFLAQGVGCTVYESRTAKACHEFKCDYLTDPRINIKPSESGVLVFTKPNEDMAIVYLNDDAWPAAWELYQYISNSKLYKAGDAGLYAIDSPRTEVQNTPMTHEPECTYYVEIYVSEYETVLSDCICDKLRGAFQRGYRKGCEEQSGRDAYNAYDKGYWDAVRGGEDNE